MEVYIAEVVELVDTLDLGSSAARCESSSLSVRTMFHFAFILFYNFLRNCLRFFDQTNFAMVETTMRKVYPSDISREQFEQIQPLLEQVRKKTKPRVVDLLEVFCAIL